MQAHFRNSKCTESYTCNQGRKALILYNEETVKIFDPLHCSSTFQVLFDVSSVFSVESLQFLVEFHVSFVDVIDVGVRIERASTTVFASFGNPFDKLKIFKKIIFLSIA